MSQSRPKDAARIIPDPVTLIPEHLLDYLKLYNTKVYSLNNISTANPKAHESNIVLEPVRIVMPQSATSQSQLKKQQEAVFANLLRSIQAIMECLPRDRLEGKTIHIPIFDYSDNDFHLLSFNIEHGRLVKPAFISDNAKLQDVLVQQLKVFAEDYMLYGPRDEDPNVSAFFKPGISSLTRCVAYINYGAPTEANQQSRLLETKSFIDEIIFNKSKIVNTNKIKRQIDQQIGDKSQQDSTHCELSKKANATIQIEFDHALAKRLSKNGDFNQAFSATYNQFFSHPDARGKAPEAPVIKKKARIKPVEDDGVKYSGPRIKGYGRR
jgi:hypothetical protein